MQSPSHRLETFKNWPHKVRALRPSLMSESGFYYTNEADKVKCAFCGLELLQWDPHDNVLNEHIKYSKNCPLVRHLAPPVAMDTCGR